MRYLRDIPRRSGTLQTLQHPLAYLPVAFDDNLDPAIDQVLGNAGQAQFQPDRPRPPAKAPALDPAAYPGREPHLVMLTALARRHQRPFRGRG